MATTRRSPRKTTKRPAADETAPLTPAEEYRAALAEFNRYSDNNETADALTARQRLDNADRDRRRRWWHFT